MTRRGPSAVARRAAFVLSALGFFGVGYEVSGGGVSGMWEHWYCATPLVVLAGALALWTTDRWRTRAV